jgi:hypothetical protein
MVVPASNLLAGKLKASLDETPADFFSWGAVHGSNANYTIG